jgi:hypothetical protein
LTTIVDVGIFVLNPAAALARRAIITGLTVGARLLASMAASYMINFNDAIKGAKLTGMLIGISLALGYPFSTQTISMIGFSLGTQVIKSCLSMLYKLKAYDIINNVTLLAGASHYEKNVEKWENIFTSVVGG